MVILAALFSQAPLHSSVGPTIHIGQPVMTLALAACWWICSFAAISLVGGAVRALFRGAGLSVAWSFAWRAALLWIASLACCFIYNVWIHPR